MKRVLTLSVLVLAGCIVRERTVIRPLPPPEPPPVTLDTFGPHLSPYGVWVVLPAHGRVWQPAVQYVGTGFYPYGSGGRWVSTSAGWVFDTEYPFGWAVFHYGRWLLDPDYGWVWVPGDVWAPSWVAWRTGGTYVGWAPLGPSGAPVFHHHHWLFVETGHFTVANVHAHAIHEQRFHEAVAVTQPVHGAVPVGPPPAYVSATTRTQIVPVPIQDIRSSGRVVPPPPGGPTPPPGGPTPPPPPPPAVAPSTGAPPPPPAPARIEPQRTRPPPPPARVEPQRLQPPPAEIAAPPPPAGSAGAAPPAPTKPKTPPPPPGTKKKKSPLIRPD